MVAFHGETCPMVGQMVAPVGNEENPLSQDFGNGLLDEGEGLVVLPQVCRH